MSKMPTKKIAITGTIGSGKSTVTKLIKSRFPTISSDDIVKRLYEEKTFNKSVNKLLFNEVNDSVDKMRIASLIFNDDEAKEKLESFIHPYVKKEIQEFLFQHHGPVFVEVPLLYEANFEDMFDKVIVVVSDEDKIIERLVKYRNFTKEDVRDRIRNQYDVKDKIREADYVIENNESLNCLSKKVEKLLIEIVGESNDSREI